MTLFFPLCLNATEMAIQMCKDRPFTAAVCTLVQDWHGASIGPPSDNFFNISKWWDDIIHGRLKGEQHTTSGRLLYVLWNTWKERNHRIFTGQRLTYIEVASITGEDILQREHTFTTYVPAVVAEPD
jgi:hypothetical protein